MDLSIVIPVYNEESKIQTDIQEADKFLTSSHLSGEILIIDDGSKDRSVQMAREVLSSIDAQCQIVEIQHNQGKGHAVRTGVKLSKGTYVMFADSGYCVDYKHALDGLKFIQKDDYDIAHGSRKLSKSIIKLPQPFIRQITSRLFRLYAITIMGIPSSFTDTQCGFKLYKGDVARELFKECHCNGFSFDVEVILRALAKGYRIVEFPIEWICDHDSRLHVIEVSKRVLAEFKQIKNSLDSP